MNGLSVHTIECKSKIVCRDNSRSSDNRSKFGPWRLGVLAERDFRRFYAGYATSLLGSAMSAVALTFAVLGSGGSATDLGFVFAAGVIPQVLFMLGGGVIADRLGRRKAMLGADITRLAAQGTLAGALLLTAPPIWLFVLLAGVGGVGEAFFAPALGGLIPAIVTPGRLGDANALIGVAQSAARVAGPALAGVLIGLTRPAVVIAVDAATFGVSLVALALLQLPPARPTGRSPWRDLADGWFLFRSQAWLCVITVQFALFNLLTWAPFLLLGPVLARQYLGGARAWGLVTAAMALGGVLAGVTLVGRTAPRRPLVAAAAGTYGYGLPCLMLSLHLPLYAVAAGAFVAGTGSATFNTYSATVTQQRVPPEMLARANAFTLTGAYALGSAGLAVIGPVAAVVGAGPMLAFAAGYNTLSSSLVLASRPIRSIR
jgi:MFS transporter